jgi:hypothetical protein
LSNDVTISVPISTVGPLDTTNPPTDRPAGTLIEAINLGSRWWGPRIPNRADTWFGQRTTSGGGQSRYITFDGSTTYINAQTSGDSVRDLGTRWTIDAWFGLADVDEDLSTVAGSNLLTVFMWNVGLSGSTVPAIQINVGGPNGPGADERKVICYVRTTSARNTVGNTYTIKSTSLVPVNTSGSWTNEFSKITHVRLVRNGSDLRLYVNGVSEATQTVSATEPTEGSIGAAASYSIGYSAVGAGQNFIGIIPNVTLRTEAYLGPVVASQLVPQCPHADDVRISVCGTYHGLADRTVLDASDNQIHGKMYPALGSVSATWQVPGGAPVQGIGHYVNRSGKHITVAMIGGTLCKVYS